MAFQVSENYIWVTKNAEELDRHPGKWVAVDQARLIAIADTLKELSEKAEVKNVEHPLFHLVPTEEEANNILIL